MATQDPGHSPSPPVARQSLAKGLMAIGLEVDEGGESSNYRPIRELSRGGMGVVFDAHDAKLDRSVAMKVMLHPDAGAEERLRFLQEASVLGKLAHPNIVPIYDVGTDELGRPFYTMKLVGGSTLQDILQRLKAGEPDALAKYPLNTLLTVLQKVCDAIAFAHARGVIHRDLKPQNIMVGDFGEVLVMDWGLAKILAGSMAPTAPPKQPCAATSGFSTSLWSSGEEIAETDSGITMVAGTFPQAPALDERGISAGRASNGQLTLAGTVMGTPNYMSPEQAAGLVEDVGPQSDVFALGGLLYAILTLHPPVEGSTREEVLSKVREGKIRPPTWHSNRQMTTATTTGARSSSPSPAAAPPLAHLPGRRVPEALSAVAMRALAADRAERYPSATAFEADLAAYLGGFATTAEQAGLGRQLSLLVQRHRTAAAALAVILLLSIGFVARLVVSERQAEKSAAEAIKAKVAAQDSAAETRRALAQSQVSLAEAAYRDLDSRAMVEALESVPSDLREGDWAYLRHRADNSQSKIVLDNGRLYIGAAAHPQLPGIFALASTEGSVHLVEARTGEIKQRVALSPRQVISPLFRSLDFSPDGRQLLVGSLQQGSLSIYDLATGHPVVEWDASGTDFTRFDRTGMLILDINLKRELTVREPVSGQILWTRKPFTRALFTANGQIIASDGNTLQRLDARSGALLEPLPPLKGRLFTMALSPDDTTLFYANSTDVFVRGMRLRDGFTTFERALTESPATWPSVTISASGRKVIGAVNDDGQKTVIRVWDTATGTRLRTLRGHDCALENVAIHPLTDEVVVTGIETHSWALASSRLPAWELEGASRAGVFLGRDDLFTASGVPLKLKGPGSWENLAAPLPAPFTGGLLASSCGDYGIIGKIGSRSQGVTGAEFILTRPNAGGLTLTPGKLQGRTAVTWSLRLSPDGRFVAACDDFSGFSLHEAATGIMLSKGNPAAGLRMVTAFDWLTPNRLIGLGRTGPRTDTRNEERLLLWDAPSGRILHKRIEASAMDCLSILPGGTLFAEAGADKRVRIRDASTLEVRREFRAHDGAVTALAAHPTQSVLATASADLFVRIWNVRDGKMIEELQPSVAVTQALQFSPSGNRLASVDQRGIVRIWDFGDRPPLASNTSAK